MKKIISISLAVIMIIAIIPFSAFAATPQKCQVHNKMVASRDKLFAGKESFSAAESRDFWIYLQAEGNPDAYRADYINSVKSAVKENTLGDAANCALAIKCLEFLGVDAKNFNTGDGNVNLYEIMKSKGTAISSPYLYRYILDSNFSDDFTTDCFNAMNADFHKGEGYYYYGYSGDNAGAMGACYGVYLVPPTEELFNARDEAIEDLKTLLLNNYKGTTGYICNSDWQIFENVDTTAVVLSFFSIITDNEDAQEAYNMLKNFEVEGESGAYCSSYAPGYDAYATKDVLIGLIDYYNSLYPLPEHNYSATIVKPTANTLGYTYYKCVCGELKRDASGKIIKTAFKAPTGKVSGVKCAARTAAAEKIAWNKVNGATGYQAQIILNGKVVQSKALSANAYVFTKLASGSAYKVRVRFYIKAADGKNYFSNWSAVLTSPTLPKGTGLTKLTAAKKAFSAKWAKQAGVTGYQINYKYFDPQSKGGAPHCKTIAIKGAARTSYAAKKLMAKTTYQVKVRTYKTIGGKNYYSAWSKIKTVKTK